MRVWPPVSYSYDSADRLTGITRRTANVGYTYDAANRRASVMLPNGIVMEYGYNAASQSALASASYDAANQIVQFGGVSFTYDANGNLTNDGMSSYSLECTESTHGIGRRDVRDVRLRRNEPTPWQHGERDDDDFSV